MSTRPAIDYKQRAFGIYRDLVRRGEYASAGRLLRALRTKQAYINISFSDIDWTIGMAFDLAHFNSIRIR